MTRRETIVGDITRLENEIETRNQQIAALKDELENTLPDLLDRDPDADRDARIEKKNNFLRSEGLLP